MSVTKLQITRNYSPYVRLHEFIKQYIPLQILKLFQLLLQVKPNLVKPQ